MRGYKTREEPPDDEHTCGGSIESWACRQPAIPYHNKNLAWTAIEWALDNLSGSGVSGIEYEK